MKTPPYNRVVLAVLVSRWHGLLDRSIVALRVRGVVTGRMLTLPVMFARTSTGLVVLPGRPENKRWWRNLEGGAPVEVLDSRTWRSAYGQVLRPGSESYDAAVAVYRQRYRRVRLPDDAPLVRIAWVQTGEEVP